MSALSLAALAVARGELAAGVKGGNPVRFVSPRIGEYRMAMGRDPHKAEPWCAEAVYWCFVQATPKGSPNPCPKTPGALHMWDLSPLACRTQLAAPGDVFVLDRGKGHGHVGFVASVSPDGRTIVSIEPDTNAAGSTTGDAWGERFWHPADGVRGRLVGYLNFG